MSKTRSSEEMEAIRTEIQAWREITIRVTNWQ